MNSVLTNFSAMGCLPAFTTSDPSSERMGRWYSSANRIKVSNDLGFEQFETRVTGCHSLVHHEMNSYKSQQPTCRVQCLRHTTCRTNVCDTDVVLRRETWAKERRTSKSAIPSLNKTCNPPARTHQEICKRRWHPCRTHQRWRRASQILDQIFYYADTTKENLCLALLVTLFRSWVTDSSDR